MAKQGKSAESATDTRRATDGELTVVTALHRALADVPGARVQLRRYTGGREIDILVLLPRVGFVVIEVKDWRQDAIAGFTDGGERVIVRTRNGVQSKENPLLQARRAATDLTNELGARVRGRGDRFALRPRWGEMCALPFLSESDWRRVGLDRTAQRHKVLLEEDFAPGGVLCDRTPARLLELLRRQGDPGPLQDPATDAALADALAAEIRNPPRPGPARAWFAARVTYLDRRQAEHAERSAATPLILCGPAGSGKTLVLVRRACIAATTQPRRRVLLTCYGIALAAHLRLLVQEQGVGVDGGPGTVHVAHFDGLVSRILGQPMDFGIEDKDYYTRARAEACRRVAEGGNEVSRYDAVLVDEGQDFDDAWIRMLLGLRTPNGEFVAVLDKSQSVFPHHRTWPDGIDGVTLVTDELPTAHRATQPIRAFIARVFAEPDVAAEAREEPDFAPPAPRVVRLQSDDELPGFLAADILRRVEDRTFGQVAILYHDKRSNAGQFVRGAREFVPEILAQLAAEAIPARWISEDTQTKDHYDPSLNRVTVSSYHSAKGLEFDIVYVLGTDRLDEMLSEQADVDAYLRVALTRACFELVVPYAQEAPVTRRLEQARTAPART